MLGPTVLSFGKISHLFLVMFLWEFVQSWIFECTKLNQICNLYWNYYIDWKTIFHRGGLPRSNITADVLPLHLRYWQFTTVVGQDSSYLFSPSPSLSYVFIEIGKYFLEFPTYFLADGFLIKLKIFPAVGFSLCSVITCYYLNGENWFLFLLLKTVRWRAYCNCNGNEKKIKLIYLYVS